MCTPTFTENVFDLVRQEIENITEENIIDIDDISDTDTKNSG